MSLEQTSLDTLCTACQQQLQDFRKRGSADTASCDEILRRAASYDESALDTLLQISKTLIERHCPVALRNQRDDWVQDILLHIAQKLRNRQSPYRIHPPPPQPFVAYQSFLKIVRQHITYNYSAFEQRQPNSLDALQTQVGDVIASVKSDIGELHKQMRFERLLALIPKPIDREIFRMRFQLHLSTDETVDALNATGYAITKKMVQRSVERTIRHLSTIPEVRELFEDEVGNED